MKDQRICAIIVTFNRKEWLGRCLKAVLSQSHKVDDIIIVDNASSDGTPLFLGESGLIKTIENIADDELLDVSIANRNIHYFRLSENKGGAGGFYHGLKIAHESGKYDSYWLMDDDGYPSEGCLEKQLPFLTTYDYVMPVSIDIDNHTRLSWATRKKNGVKTLDYKELIEDWGQIIPFIFPFNGSLMSKRLVEKVGYINPKLFIWGDDYEHYYRCLKEKFTPITVLDAIFYHPVNKAPVIPIFFKKIPVPYVNSELRFVCLIRNWVFINKKNHRYWIIFRNLLAYSWLFLITRKFDLRGYKLYLESTFDGLREKFDRHKKYLK